MHISGFLKVIVVLLILATALLLLHVFHVGDGMLEFSIVIYACAFVVGMAWLYDHHRNKSKPAELSE